MAPLGECRATRVKWPVPPLDKSLSPSLFTSHSLCTSLSLYQSTGTEIGSLQLVGTAVNIYMAWHGMLLALDCGWIVVPVNIAADPLDQIPNGV